MKQDWPSRKMLESLRLIAPGTPLRTGIERILSSKTGGLLVLGWDQKVERICTGGFHIDAQLTPQRLSELSKMDGAMILDAKASRILRANVHLMPHGDIGTAETGTRHRTAEKVAKQIGHPTVSVSQKMNLISVYREHEKHVLAPITRVLANANQATSTLERYRARFDAVSASLSALEVEDLVTARDVLLVLQRGEMVRRIAEEARILLVELGTDGRLLELQVDELAFGIEGDLELDLKDYLQPRPGSPRGPRHALDLLAGMPIEEVADLYSVAKVMHVSPSNIDEPLSPRGYRFLSRIPRLSSPLVERIVERFDSLQKILNASLGEFEDIEGVGEVRALQIKEGLARLAESSILDRYS